MAYRKYCRNKVETRYTNSMGNVNVVDLNNRIANLWSALEYGDNISLWSLNELIDIYNVFLQHNHTYVDLTDRFDGASTPQVDEYVTGWTPTSTNVVTYSEFYGVLNGTTPLASAIPYLSPSNINATTINNIINSFILIRSHGHNYTDLYKDFSVNANGTMKYIASAFNPLMVPSWVLKPRPVVAGDIISRDTFNRMLYTLDFLVDHNHTFDDKYNWVIWSN